MARKNRKHLYDGDIDIVEETSCVYAGAYLRISGDDKKKRGDSIETQRNIIENHVAAIPDIELRETYVDDNITGTSFDRPGFRKMLNDAESGVISCIIVKDLTRFGRNAIDSGYYLEKRLPSLGIRFISVTDNYDSAHGDGGMLLPLKMILGESYALDIGKKCHATWQQNILDGRFIGRLAPYGYMKDPADCHRLVIDDDSAAVVRRVFDWAYEGIGINEITRRLNGEGVPSPAHYNFDKGYNTSEKLHGSPYWKSTSIRNMLSDRVYVGAVVGGKSRTINHKRVEIDPSEWVCVEGMHEPIISTDIFESIQERRHEAKSQATPVRTRPYSHNAFIGKIICAGCGYMMKRKRQNKDGIYWFRCETQWKFSKDACTVVSVKEADLAEKIMMLLQKQSEAMRGELISIEKASSKQEKERLDAELRSISSGLAKDSRLLKSLYESMISGIITPDEFSSMKMDYESRIAGLSSRADAIRNTRRTLERHKSVCEDIASAVAAVLENDAVTAEIIGLLVDKVMVNPDKSFEVFLKYNDEFKEYAK